MLVYPWKHGDLWMFWWEHHQSRWIAKIIEVNDGFSSQTWLIRIFRMKLYQWNSKCLYILGTLLKIELFLVYSAEHSKTNANAPTCRASRMWMAPIHAIKVIYIYIYVNIKVKGLLHYSSHHIYIHICFFFPGAKFPNISKHAYVSTFPNSHYFKIV